MADVLRAAASVDGFLAAVKVNLVETSPVLATHQRRSLSTVVPPIVWHERFAEVPDGSMIVIANEFLDALPIRQFLRTRAGWSERRVDFWDDGLVWVDAPTLPPTSIDAPVGAIVELSPAREALVREVAGRIVRSGGAALFIDYGHMASAPGDTLQAVKDHRFHDVLADPGEADLTSHVDFERLGDAARAVGATVHGPVLQGDFLRALGIEMRAHMLSQGASRRDAAEVRAALRRLTHPDEMGTLFKAFALTGREDLRAEGFGG
jgi:SAM-dependent MidA family methyltransferase